MLIGSLLIAAGIIVVILAVRYHLKETGTEKWWMRLINFFLVWETVTFFSVGLILILAGIAKCIGLW